ncbi:hypothetical protein [Tenacibaculum ovolyticum]|uniref:hypothetical protein n=1 Tax=Tenacibaculum ovolyticum TaxID=104270 RepID=UPI003BAA062F
MGFATIAIVIIIILGWIIFEQSDKTKNRNEREQKFQRVDVERKEKAKQNPEFLKNLIKMDSTFELLTTLKIDNFKTDYISGEDDKAHEKIHIIHLFYFDMPFSLRLIASTFESRCIIQTSKNRDIFISLEYDNKEDNDLTIDKILSNIKRVAQNSKT